jgi:predicted acyltransferase
MSTSISSKASTAQAEGAVVPVQRVASVDAYRGFVMLLMMAEVLSFQHVSESLPGSSFWAFLYHHQDHVPWVGIALHDMIQPSFSFLVGVAMPYSIASRVNKGGTFGPMFLTALRRSLVLILLGIFLRSQYRPQTYFTFEDTLSQIGLGYPFLFILGFQNTKVRVISFVVLLVGYFTAFALYPLPGADFNYAAAGVTPGWEHNLSGFAAHWNKNTNFAWNFDKWFLNLFPRESKFQYNEGGYSTLSFVTTLGTMILGLLAGSKLRAHLPDVEKVKYFLTIGAAILLLGLILQWTGINPIVKRIWTPAWTLFSGGLCFLFLSFFYYVIDMKQHKRWAFFLMVIGMNSIAAYFLADGFSPFIIKTLYIHFGHYDTIFGDAYSTLIKGAFVLTLEWLILYWMYKKKLFIKI